jgi:hypothetical protein
MKKTELIKKAKERFSNLPQDVAVVVKYKGDLVSVLPIHFDYPNVMNQLKMKGAYAFVYGEIVQEEQTLCGNTEFQTLTCRVEAQIDLFTMAAEMMKQDQDFFVIDFKASEGFPYDHKAQIAVPSNMSLVEVKKWLYDFSNQNDLYDNHILIQSLDYPIFQGRRDRNSPQPQELK